MLDVNLRTSTVVTRDHTVQLSGKDIIYLLRQELKAQGVQHQPPDDAEVEFSVPGGGDYSNCNLDIDEDQPVTVRWSERNG